MIKTVLGDIAEQEVGVTLAHEHICCYSEYLYQMLGAAYLDKARLEQVAVALLKELKERFALSTFIDCTPVNIGRDVDLLRRVSRQAGVHIVGATGFYYTDEAVLFRTDAQTLADCMVLDAKKVNAGLLKCAVEADELSPFNEKVLRATALAHQQTGLPIVMHTHAGNQNGRRALDILLEMQVAPSAITVSHLSGTTNLAYLSEIAAHGCFIALDRLMGYTTPEYIEEKLVQIRHLCDNGYADRLLLSHDAPFFSGFSEEPAILERPRLAYLFEHILPHLPAALARKIMVENPVKMLTCGR